MSSLASWQSRFAGEFIRVNQQSEKEIIEESNGKGKGKVKVKSLCFN
jgi:hypothetical protein